MNHWTDPLQGIACDEGIDDGKQYATFTDWWNGTQRGDYMNWVLLNKALEYPDFRKVCLISCRRIREIPIDDNRTVWDVYANDQRVRNAIEVVGQFANGELTEEVLRTTIDEQAWEAATATICGLTYRIQEAVRDTLLSQTSDIIREVVPAEEVAPLMDRYFQLLQTNREKYGSQKYT